MNKLKVGLYELLHTRALQKQLENSNQLDFSEYQNLEVNQIKHHLTLVLAREIAIFIEERFSGANKENLLKELRLLATSQEMLNHIVQVMPETMSLLKQINPPPPLTPFSQRPDTPLSTAALLTGSARNPNLLSQLKKELATCDRADWLVAFIKFAGIKPLMETLQQFTQDPAPDGSLRLRIATTSYLGATDWKAIRELSELPNTEIRISYDTKRTRLHAKAYLFHRQTGFSTAYIGSANISKAALDEGLEWTAKFSQYETGYLWDHAKATFDSHWEDEKEFKRFTSADLTRLKIALAQERGDQKSEGELVYFVFKPYDYQQVILEDIAAERNAGKNKHLVIAATGTGKTMIAAFDYARYCRQKGVRVKLLFLAHREEILKQALASFRQVLKDGSYGNLVTGMSDYQQTDHLFCTVQSWNSRGFDRFDPQHFEYVVLDEAHHATAQSYQKMIQHIQPLSLLGLTATPERTDGEDIRKDFEGTFTHEIRLPEAIERNLLCPFHYYGIPDFPGLDFSNLSWQRGGYDFNQLKNLLEGNTNRAHWIITQTERYVADLQQVRGLGFCVSVEHARFMAAVFNENGIPALALSGGSSRDERNQAQQRLANRELRFIFTVDLYNEGVDIPAVDTIVFLRPTESLILFLQQLGRGLRLYDNKSHLTVLDFIAPQHRHFSYRQRFRALVSRPELRVDDQVESGFPFIPSGCLIHLEPQAKAHVLNNIRNATAGLRSAHLIQELRQLQHQLDQPVQLVDILNYLHLESPDDLYRRGLPNILLLQAEGKTAASGLMEVQEPLAKGFRRTLLMDDTHLISEFRNMLLHPDNTESPAKKLMHSLLWGKQKPYQDLEALHQFLINHPGLRHDLLELLQWLLNSKTPNAGIKMAETSPLHLHASYTREQVLLALEQGTFKKPKSSREGVLHIPEKKLDVFFADIDKNDSDFSPTTMYEDYAITDELFHWQSQSQTSEDSPVGQRYIHHRVRGYNPVLFIRQKKKLANGLTAPYFFAGPLQYHQHSGSRPVSFVWKLKFPLPARVQSWARRVG